MAVPLEARCSLSEDRLALATSPCERLRFSRLEWEVLLGRLPEELLRDDSLTSLVERRCAEADVWAAADCRECVRSVGEVVRRVSFGAAWPWP